MSIITVKDGQLLFNGVCIGLTTDILVDVPSPTIPDFEALKAAFDNQEIIINGQMNQGYPKSKRKKRQGAWTPKKERNR